MVKTTMKRALWMPALGVIALAATTPLPANALAFRGNPQADSAQPLIVQVKKKSRVGCFVVDQLDFYLITGRAPKYGGMICKRLK